MSSNIEPAVIKDCPTPNELRALLDGTMPEGIATALQRHVDQCRTCQKALETLTVGGESWVGVVHELKQPAGSGSEHHLQEAMSRMKSDDSGTGERPSPDAPTRLDFLSPSDQPGSLGKLGNYEISEVVGQGGMGVVLKAFDPSLHRVVAVKVLASHLAHHATARKRFIREAQAAAAVCHENVVTIHAIDESGPQPKIVMQFVSGGSLQERLDQEGPFELKEILRIGMQTAAGLAAAHAQGLVHRDVKPANILLENGVQRVKLTDFGLARVVDDASLTLSGVIAGTPQYMAPEQAWGKVVDHRADLFGLGAVMYAMCVGHSPFRARSTMAVLKRVCEEEPRPIAAINPDIPDWFCRIISKLLAKQPTDRFQTATEVSELLAQCLAHVQQPHVVPLPKECSKLAASPPSTAEQESLSKNQPQVATIHNEATADVGSTTQPLVASVLPLAYRIPYRLGLGPILITVMAVASFSVLFDWPAGPPNAYFGFSASMIAVSILGWSCFYLAWSTENWRLRAVCISILLLSGAWMSVVLVDSSRRPPIIVQLVVVILFAFTLLYVALLVLVRPWLTGTWQRWLGLPYVPPSTSFVTTPAQTPLSPWYRLARLAVAILIAAPIAFGVLLVTTWLSYRSQERTAEQAHAQAVEAQQQMIVAQERAIPQDQRSIPQPAAGVEKIRGRWVVLTVQGPEPPFFTSQIYGGTTPGTPGMMPPAAMMMGSGSSSSFGSTATTNFGSPQWIEITNRQLKLMTSREVTFDLAVQNGRELHLREPESGVFSDVRTGIFTLDGDRLLICWGGGHQTAPDELKASQIHQLLVCRREWKDEPEISDPFAPPILPSEEIPTKAEETNSANVKAPRAEIPFTPQEAAAYQQAWARKLKGKVETTNAIGMKLRLIPPGSIPEITEPPSSGGIPANSRDAAQPRRVFAGPIMVGVYEVTRGQFRKFIDETQYVTSAEVVASNSPQKPVTWREPQIEQDSDEHPVVSVSFTDAIAFTQWLSRKEGKPYRVLSSDEWEFVTRAGSMANITIGSDKLKHRSQFFTTTAPVGSYSRNPFGLHDLIGNAAEWTWSTSLKPSSYDDLSVPVNSAGMPMGRLIPVFPQPTPKLCGGDFATSIDASQPGSSANNNTSMTESVKLAAGFRVAVDLTESTLLTLSDDLNPSRSRSTFSLDSVWCDLQLQQQRPDPLDATKTKPEPAIERRVAVAVRDAVPLDELPYDFGWNDFEVQRAVVDAEHAKMLQNDDSFRDALVWKSLDVAATIKLLERCEVATEVVPAPLTNPVFTMPIPNSKDSVLSPFASAPFVKQQQTSKCEFGHPTLFRYFDFDVEAGQRYAYRYRLRYLIRGIDDKAVRTTPWKTTRSVVEVKPDPAEKKTES